MDDVLPKVLADLLALIQAADGRDAARIAEIIARLRGQDAHDQHAARLYARLGDRPLPQPAGTVSPLRDPAPRTA
jgi:hypothetical protein